MVSTMSLIVPGIIREKPGDDGTEELVKVIDDVGQISITSAQEKTFTNCEKSLLEMLNSRSKLPMSGKRLVNPRLAS